MAIFLLLLVCPWITLVIKSRTAKELAYALINFCNSHFVGIDDLRDANGVYMQLRKTQMIFNNLVSLFYYF